MQCYQISNGSTKTVTMTHSQRNTKNQNQYANPKIRKKSFRVDSFGATFAFSTVSLKYT